MTSKWVAIALPLQAPGPPSAEASGVKEKVCLVTGGSSGIGLATCRGLLELGHRVITTTRQGRPPALSGKVEVYDLDLADLDSVHRFVGQLSIPQIDILIHNAGAVFPRRHQTPQGFEAQFAIIYLGPFLLTRLLQPKLQGAHIINVVSDLHRRVRGLNWEDLQSRRNYHFLNSYSQAELAKVMFTYELARRGYWANCLHPGGVRSRLFRNFRPPLSWLIWLSNGLKVGPKRGARTSLYLATSPEVEGQSGGYYVNCRRRRSSAASYREEDWLRLWELTESWIPIGP